MVDETYDVIMGDVIVVGVPLAQEQGEEEEGVTELMGAAADGDTGRVVALLAAPGIDVNAATGSGWTALMLAANGGHTEVVTALLAAPGLDVNAANGDGDTALALAEGQGLGAEPGHVAIASLLRASQ